MLLKQYYLGCLSHASYLVGDEKAGVAAVVDPQRDVDQYVEDAAALGVEIRWVLLTHFHADFVSGHLELQARAGSRIGLSRLAEADYDFTPLADGASIDLGDVRIQVLETPGHTPESACFVVFDAAKDPRRPHAVLTGDTLFIGDVGRPDLLASTGSTSEEQAGRLHDSLRTKLLTLPDDTLVYPAHGAGSACGKSLSSETVSTIGEQRRTNPMLQEMSREEFVRRLVADLPEPPPYFAHDSRQNREQHEVLEDSLDRALSPLPLADVLRLRSEGAEIVDTRDPAEFAAGHLRGSVNIGLGGKYASWAGHVIDREVAIVLVAAPGREREAALRLGRIGFDRVVGYLQGGPGALLSEGRPDLLGRIERVQPADLAQSLTSVVAPAVLDVRTSGERAKGHVESSLHVPLSHLLERMREVPRHRRVVVHCESGYRSSLAVSLLQRAGFMNVEDLVGGWQAYAQAQAASAPAA